MAGNTLAGILRRQNRRGRRIGPKPRIGAFALILERKKAFLRHRKINSGDKADEKTCD